MAFSVEDFQDLVRLLGEHPEWRAELRRHVLSDELLELPELVRGLAEAQRRTDEHLEALTQRLDALATQVQFLVGRVGEMDGELLESRFARRAPAYLGRFGRRFRVLDPSQLADMLDAAVDARHLTESERDTIMLADVVTRGRRKSDGADVYFVTEVSAGIGTGDVRRVIERSHLLEKLGQPVVPVVAGRWINYDADEYARASGVEQVIVPRKTAPPGDDVPPA